MARPYEGISEKEAIEIMIYNLLQIPVVNRQEVVDYSREGFCRENEREAMMARGENFSIAITTLGCLFRANEGEYCDWGKTALEHIKIYDQVAEINTWEKYK